MTSLEGGEAASASWRRRPRAGGVRSGGRTIGGHPGTCFHAAITFIVGRFPTFTAKRVPRMPMVAVGVSKRLFGGRACRSGPRGTPSFPG